MKRDLVITFPSLGGSGYLTLAENISDAAIKAGHYSIVYQCRGLAQAEGPMCLDTVVSEREIHGAVARDVNYMNAYEMTEVWRMFQEAGKQVENAYTKDLTIVTDYKIIEPIAVMTSAKGPRYYTREELLEVLKNYKIAGSTPRIIAYDFSKYKQFGTVLKGPYSFGLIVADLEKRNDIVKIPRDKAEAAVFAGAPQKGKLPQQNVEAFQKGYDDRIKAKEGKVMMI